jgi:hypothetical protein
MLKESPRWKERRVRDEKPHKHESNKSKGVVSCYGRLFLSFGEHTFFNLAFVRLPNIKLHQAPWKEEDSSYQRFIGLAYQGQDIVFSLVIVYSSLTDFGPLVIGLFLYEDF